METACFYGEYEDLGLVKVFQYFKWIGRLVYGVWSRKCQASKLGKNEMKIF